MQASVTLKRTVLDWCDRQKISLAGKTVIAAVSGGRDSMALLHILLELAPKLGFAVAAAHYNHRLRESAARDESLVRTWCAQNGIPLLAGGGDVRAYAEETGTSIEDAARTMRYAFLREAAEEYGADYIATAHHRQDNAETVLLHLLRGSGLNGLGGIRSVRGCIIRPLLEADRADIDAYIRDHSIPYAEDETNRDTAYMRNRLRLELLPLLEEIAPGSVARIADAAGRLQADEDFLQRQSDALTPDMDGDGCVRICTKTLSRQLGAISARIIRGAARQLGAELTAAQTDGVLCLKNGGCLSLGGSLRAAREGNTLCFYRLPDAPPPLALSPGQHRWGDWTVTVFETDGVVCEDVRTAVLRTGLQSIVLSPWDGTGRLSVENGRRTVKRLLADRGIPAAQRELCPAVFSGGKLAAVFGAGTDYPLRPREGEKKLVIALRHEDQNNE